MATSQAVAISSNALDRFFPGHGKPLVKGKWIEPLNYNYTPDGDQVITVLLSNEGWDALEPKVTE